MLFCPSGLEYEYWPKAKTLLKSVRGLRPQWTWQTWKGTQVEVLLLFQGPRWDGMLWVFLPALSQLQQRADRGEKGGMQWTGSIWYLGMTWWGKRGKALALLRSGY